MTRRLGALLATGAALLAVGALASAGCGGKRGAAAGAGARTAATGQGGPSAGAAVPGVTPATGSYRGPVPILMYHVVSAPPPGVPYAELWTPRERFRDTLALLVREGYRGVTLDQAWSAWHGGPGLPRKPVVVSFDDGYLSHVTHAKPALRAVGWPGVLNVEGKNIGPGGLTRRQVRTLISAGWEIDAHSLTHPDLTTLDDAALRREVAGSRALLQREFGVPVHAFCYPAGRHDARVDAAVRAAGYRAATTVEPGIASGDLDQYALPRIRVNGGDAPATVLAHLRAGVGSVGGGEG